MPIYTFKCSSCEHEFSGIFSMNASDGKGVLCPKCESAAVSRVYKSGPVLVSKAGSKPEVSASCPSCSGGVCDL